jgi:hypothetical protein
MKRFAAVAVLILLTACTQPRAVAVDTINTHSVATSLDSQATNPTCRFGPDGEPVADTTTTAITPMLADRGIGGTGAPQGRGQRADRGIGGTGIGGTGIGGTGIIGVITGFASICVNGVEVTYDKSASVDIDGSAGTAAALRAGQVVAIQARDATAVPLVGTIVAEKISVRRQVTGKIGSVEPATSTLTVAGQTVMVPAGTWGADSVRLGDWVAISGLRRADGTLVATRLDPAPAATMSAGTTTVRGRVVRDGDTMRIGQLVLAGPAAADLQNGQFVTVSGQYVADQFHLRSVSQDPLMAGPGAYFGNAFTHFVLQAYVHVANGMVFLNGLTAAVGPAINGKTGADGLAIVSLERQRDGTFTAIGLRYVDHPEWAPRHTPDTSLRENPMAPPRTRGTGTAMASLATGTGVSSPGGQSVTTATSAADKIPPAGVTRSTPTASPPADAGVASTRSQRTPSSAPPSLTVAMPPSTTTTSVVPISISAIPADPLLLPAAPAMPVDSATKIESEPSNPPLISAITPPGDHALTLLKGLPTHHPTTAVHSVITSTAAPSATVSLTNETLTTSADLPGTAAAKPPAAATPAKTSFSPTGASGSSILTSHAHQSSQAHIPSQVHIPSQAHIPSQVHSN